MMLELNDWLKSYYASRPQIKEPESNAVRYFIPENFLCPMGFMFGTIQNLEAFNKQLLEKNTELEALHGKPDTKNFGPLVDTLSDKIAELKAGIAEKDKRIAELETERKILETTIQELRETDWAAVNIESQKRIAELEALEAAFAEYERETETVPVGHENRSNGAVTYNWRTRMAQEIRSKAARLREGDK